MLGVWSTCFILSTQAKVHASNQSKQAELIGCHHQAKMMVCVVLEGPTHWKMSLTFHLPAVTAKLEHKTSVSSEKGKKRECEAPTRLETFVPWGQSWWTKRTKGTVAMKNGDNDFEQQCLALEIAPSCFHNNLNSSVNAAETGPDVAPQIPNNWFGCECARIPNHVANHVTMRSCHCLS